MTALKMNTKEMLRLAALAAGIAIDKSYGDKTGFDVCGNVVLDWHNGVTWNPLDNDGDALILAVGLRLEIEFGSHFVNVGRSDINKEWHLAREEFGNNPLAATRLAIVRAAAEIGRRMIQQATCVDLPEDNYYKSITDSQ